MTGSTNEFVPSEEMHLRDYCPQRCVTGVLLGILEVTCQYFSLRVEIDATGSEIIPRL